MTPAWTIVVILAVLAVIVCIVTWASFRIEYTDDGVWRIGDLCAPHATETAIIPARNDDRDTDGPDDEHGCPSYSDKIVIGMGAIEARRVNISVEAVFL